MRKPNGLKAKNVNITAHSVSLVWSRKPPVAVAVVRWGLLWRRSETGSSFIDIGEAGERGAGAGDNDGSLMSERGGVNSPHNKSRKFWRCAVIFNDMFSAFNLAFEFCRNLINQLLSYYFEITVMFINMIRKFASLESERKICF